MIQRFRKQQKSDFSGRLTRFGQWFESELGQELLASECHGLDHELRTVFGYHCCQYSVSPDSELLKNTQIRKQFVLNPFPMDRVVQPLVVSEPYGWPVTPGSLDLALLHHTLEIADSPHRLLSEAANTIIPEGKLIIIGFNPISLTSMTRWLLPGQRSFFSDVNFLSSHRLKDWLTLLNFNVEKVHFGGYFFPFKRLMKAGRTKRLEEQCNYLHLPFGGYYMIVATRLAPGMTPLRYRWPEMRPSLVGSRVARPSASRYKVRPKNPDVRR